MKRGTEKGPNKVAHEIGCHVPKDEPEISDQTINRSNRISHNTRLAFCRAVMKAYT